MRDAGTGNQRGKAANMLDFRPKTTVFMNGERRADGYYGAFEPMRGLTPCFP
jgi:hypothetical protein